MEKKGITFVGAGNLAWHLAPALENVGYTVASVYSKTPQNARALVKRLYDAKIQEHLDFSESMSSIFFLTVRDEAMENVASDIKLPSQAILLHCSGSQPLNLLKKYHENIGVFYPLQTFSKEKSVVWDEVPILIESDKSIYTNLLNKIAKLISKKVIQASSEQRKFAHLAAVFACNFSNHMFYVAQKILEQKNISFEVLHPLIVETINKSLAIGPNRAQTGPAARGDLKILDQHMTMLQQNSDKTISDIYQTISQHILDIYQA